MSTIVTRASKGSPLTNTEVDTNFTNLNTDKIQSGNTVATLDINGGTIDATVIGGTTRAAGSFTTLNANGNVTLGDATADTITATGRFNTDLVPSTDNARDLGTAALKWKQVFATTFTENAFPVVSQTDIGTAPNEIPLNQFLGDLAYQDAGSIAGDVVVGGGITASGPSVISVNSTTNALRITQTGTGNALLVEDTANPDATPFVIDASGNVVVGSTSVLASISGITPQFQVVGTGINSSSIGAFNYNNSTNGPFLTFAKSRSATVGTEAIVQSGDNLLTIRGYGSDGVAPIQAAQIRVEVDGTPGTNDMPGRLVFSTTADGASTPTEAMRIDNKQNTIQKVNTTAATLATNNTLTFSIVDNSTLRISVRGSDGVTRTATVALT